MQRALAIFLLALGLTVALSGCGPDRPPPASPPADKQQEIKVPVPPPPPPPPPHPFKKG
jgi:predicted small lipoprotein YifL